MQRPADQLARKIAEDILRDLSDRYGLRQELDRIDDGVKEQMLQHWAHLVKKRLSEQDG
jgi:hypothetical protein